MKTNLYEIKRRVLPILKKEGVTKAALFGSVVRGDATSKSDIDLLIDLPRGKSLFDLAGLQTELKEVLGKEIDIITYNSINPLLRDSILKNQFSLI